jgi:MFS family permease
MYLTDGLPYREALGRLVRAGRLGVSRNVWFLGFTSLFTDISSEMVTSVLPAYLVLHLGLSPLGYGTIDGLYQGVSSIVLFFGGAIADRTRRHREVAAGGYVLSALCKLGLLLAGTWSSILGVITVDRLGKGLRTAPRDALISLSSEPRQLATAFGVHRALDATGALIGPFVAFVILALAPRSFDSVFVVSFSAAVVGLAVLLLFVQNAQVALDSPSRQSLRQTTAALLQVRRFRRVLMAAGTLGLATVSDGFIFLGLQRGSQFGAQVFPLLALATAGGYLISAIPAGWCADRAGRARVFVLGHAVLLMVYGILWIAAPGPVTTFGCAAILGAYYAMTDGVLAASVSAMLDARVRATGLSLVGMTVSLSRLVASVAFGWLWTWWGLQVAVMAFALALALAIPAGGWWLGGLDRHADE